LSKPIDEAELAKICLAVEERAGLGARS
jgi:hypothetical protein